LWASWGELYVFGGVELVTDIASYDGTLANVLISHEDYFELLNRVAVRGEADAIAHNYPNITTSLNKIIMAEASSKPNSNLSEFNRYLDNNLDVLSEKFYDYHPTSFPLKALSSSPHIQGALGYIYDVFNFSKYKSNPQLNYTLTTSLTQNITDFQASQTADTYNAEMAVRLLRYCIQHNDMFAVHYDKKKAAK
jgi:hypothetical protein